MINLANKFLAVEYDTNDPMVLTEDPSSSTNRNRGNGRVWQTRDTFLPHMQPTTVKVRISTGKDLSDSTQVLPGALEELFCETTWLKPYAYIWDNPENCVFFNSPNRKNQYSETRNEILFYEWTRFDHQVCDWN